MSSKHLTIYTCDTCGKVTETDKYQADGWSVWYLDDDDKTKEFHRDICDECTKSYWEAA